MLDADSKKQIFHDNYLPIKDAKLVEGTVLTVKNLGKQIKWEYVFFIEYFGPILIMPLFYLLGDKQNYTKIQKIGLAMGVGHYLKREL